MLTYTFVLSQGAATICHDTHHSVDAEMATCANASGISSALLAALAADALGDTPGDLCRIARESVKMDALNSSYISVVSPPPRYNAWPMVQALPGARLLKRRIAAAEAVFATPHFPIRAG